MSTDGLKALDDQLRAAAPRALATLTEAQVKDLADSVARGGDRLRSPARILHRDPDALAYLEEIPSADVRQLRERITDVLFDGEHGDGVLEEIVRTAAGLAPAERDAIAADARAAGLEEQVALLERAAG